MRYDDGNWYAMTLGELISLLVDAGRDPAAMMRVIKDGPPINGAFARKLEIILMPDGQVKQIIQELKPKSVHNVLVELLREGVVK